jgi:hypothetical protein
MSGGNGLFSDVASDVVVLSVRGGGRNAVGAEATLKEGSEPKASDAHETQTTRSAVMTALIVATGSRIFQPKRISWS